MSRGGRPRIRLLALLLASAPAPLSGQVPLRPMPMGVVPSRTTGPLPVPHRIVPEEGVCLEELPRPLTTVSDTVYRDSSYIEATVDRPPELLKIGKRRYPPGLERAGVGGQAVFTFVIDTLGRPEPCSFRVYSVVDPGLEVAGLRMILESLFRPGEVRGHKVRVLVSQSVTFNP